MEQYVSFCCFAANNNDVCMYQSSALSNLASSSCAEKVANYTHTVHTHVTHTRYTHTYYTHTYYTHTIHTHITHTHYTHTLHTHPHLNQAGQEIRVLHVHTLPPAA
jgi:hypothetical protein